MVTCILPLFWYGLPLHNNSVPSSKSSRLNWYGLLTYIHITYAKLYISWLDVGKLFVYSNTAGVQIMKHTLNFWHDGGEREKIELRDMEMLVTTAAVNTKSSKSFYKIHNNPV